MWLALVSLVVSQSPIDSEKLQLALTLNRAEGPTAETKLRADPKSAVPVLSLVMRAGGPLALQGLLRTPLKCVLGSAIVGGMPPKRSPASDAAVILAALAAEREEVRVELAKSGAPMNVMVATLSAWTDEKALEVILRVMEVAGPMTDAEREFLTKMNQCSKMTRSSPNVENREQILERLSMASIEKKALCNDLAEATELLANGKPISKGWSSSNDDVSAFFELGEYSVTAKAPCVLALYDAAPSPRMLDSILQPRLGSPLEGLALDRLERDLEKFDEAGKKDALRTLIGRGRQLPRISEFTAAERANSDDLIRGGLMLNDPTAYKALLAQLACPFGGASRVELLSVAKDKKAVKAEAQRLLETCPRASGAAAAVLAELGDMSWLKRTAQITEDVFSKQDLERALTSKWSSGVETQLRALNGTADFARWRDDFIERQKKKR